MGTVQNFLIVGITDTSLTWGEFCSWFTLRGLPEPPYSNDGIFVASPDGAQLLAGVCIYPTDGPYAVVEWASTNPRVSKRLAYEAMLAGARALRVYGAMRKKWMLCFPRTKGIELVLKRAGFTLGTTPVMKCPPLGELR